MGKKSLEQLFKEVFKDYKETPDENVWNAIEASLDKKEQKKRVIPIWWRLGGVAALLAILFYIVNPLGGSQENNDIIITETQKNNDSVSEDGVSEENDSSQQVVESSADKNLQSEQDSSQGSESSIIENQSIQSNQEIVSNENGEEAKKTTVRADGNVTKNEERAVAAIEVEKQKNTDIGADKKNTLKGEVSLANEDTTEKTPSNNPNIEDEIVQDKELFNNTKEENAIAENQMTQQEVAKEKTDDQDQESNDSLEKKSIFEVIEEKEDEAVAANTSSKWSVGPSVAPVYFSATGNGSPIHSIFSSNSKSGKVNLSYGLTVAYAIGKKLKVRSGVHKVDYGYDTNNVVFSASLDATNNQKIDNIDYRQASRTIVVQSQNNIPQPSANDALVELAANENPSFDGKMIQQLGYVEVPLELDYALIDKKFGVNLIGGVSSLFLVDNSVLLESENLITEVGEANNANTVNFSTNIGVGLNYEFSPKVQLNVEPVFKYQLNTFSETAGSFRPFSVGVYSGVRFKF